MDPVNDTALAMMSRRSEAQARTRDTPRQRGGAVMFGSEERNVGRQGL